MKIRVTQVYSGIGQTERQRATLLGLGLKRLHQTRVLLDTPQTRGMVNKVAHLIRWETVNE